MIFLLGTIGLGLEWVFGLIQVTSESFGYCISALNVMGHLIGGLGVVLAKVLAQRVLIEIGVAVTKLLACDEDKEK